MADAPSGYLSRTLPGNGHDLSWSYKAPPLVVVTERFSPLGLLVAAELGTAEVLVAAQDALTPLGLLVNAELIPLMPCDSMVTEIYPLVIGCETVVSAPYEDPSSS